MSDPAYNTLIDESRLPPEILRSTRAVLWNRETRGGKPTKVPYQVKRPTARAAVDDPNTWGDFEQALLEVESGKADGAGFVLGNEIVGVDLDHCRDPETGVISEEAQRIIGELESYTELSPSGEGVHILLRGKLPAGRRRKGNVEMYADGRYFTITGKHLSGTPTTIEEGTERLAQVHARVFDGSNGKGIKHPAPPSVNLELRDDQLIERAKRANNGSKFSALWDGDTSAYSSASEADLALVDCLAFWTAGNGARMDGLFRQSGLMREKWDERRGSQSYGAKTIETALASCREFYSGNGNSPMRSQANESEPGTKPAPAASSEPVLGLTDFYAHMPSHQYIFIHSGETWPASSVNARIQPIATGGKKKNGDDLYEPASAWLDRLRPVEQMTWAPGEPMLIQDRLISQGGWIHRTGCATFNLYHPPAIALGNATNAGQWLDHLRFLYPSEADHIAAWLAQRVQNPAVKINHALVLGGKQGIGKDTLLEPVKYAIGPWNFCDVSPAHLLGRFNGFSKSVILRVSEARDLGDVDRYAFYEHLKVYTAAPPDVLRCDEKNLREHAVLNCCGVVITTNHKTDGVYIPPDDRRHFVAWSDLNKDDFSSGYWTNLYQWYDREGSQHVAAYLAGLDLSGFDPKAPPPKTAAFWDIVDANRAPEDAELADVIDALNKPDAVTLDDLAQELASRTDRASLDFRDWLRDRKNRRQIPHRLESAGYVPVRNEDVKDGLWVIGGRRMVVYAKAELTLRDRIAAAQQKR